MNEFLSNESHPDGYDALYNHIIDHIKNTKNNIEMIKENAILNIYWDLGEMLLEMDNISEEDLISFRENINKQIENDALLCNASTNTHWLKLAKRWVQEHYNYDKKIMLSGSVTWVQWALLLDVVISAPQRYWLACQAIKHKWDTIALLRAAQSLPEQYLNLG